ncbi:MAG: hypothetical protein O7B25_12875, partial [Gammaproteobacteria bacterium]|nr:hypothetical protein [Gammaproteobacteria bacterium]
MNYKGPVHRAVRLSLLLLIATLITPLCWADARDQAKRIHDRIAGVPPDPALLTTMATQITNNNAVAAALMATDAPEFYGVTLKNWAAPWSNRDQSVFVPLDDYTATIIGIVRDELDFRQILQGDILYVGSGAGVPGYSNTNNAHYEALENQGVDLMANLQATTQSSLTGVPASATAGVMTTRSAAKAFLIDGTNRAMFRFTMLNHLCNDMAQVLDTTRPPDRIRQDVSRSPGGDSTVFLNNCIGCHSGMDPMAQAFAYYTYDYDEINDPDGVNGRISYNTSNELDPVTGTRVHAKYFNNNLNFEPGFITTDDAWDNYWRDGPNALLGWDPALAGSGSGAKSMGQELANSGAFAQCQVEKVFANVCLRPVQDTLDR